MHVLCETCESKVRTLKLLDEALSDCDEAERRYGIDLSDERAELRALRDAVEASEPQAA